MPCLNKEAYLSTLPLKSGISRFSDHFMTSRSYFKDKPILTLFGPSPDFYFIAKIKKNRGDFYHLFLRVFTVFKVKVGLTSAWTREFPVSSGSFHQWYAVITSGRNRLNFHDRSSEAVSDQ